MLIIFQQKKLKIMLWKNHEGTPWAVFHFRCVAGSEDWVPCNEKPVKTCRYPVLGLAEGQTYQFRVKAVNKEGISHPSKASDPVTTYDPSKDKRVTGLY